MLTNAEFKDFMQKHKDEILNNDWTAVYDDLWYLDASSLTNFLLNKAHINPLYYMTSVPTHFAYKLDIPSINIPNNITSIKESAFADCSSLTSITIPNSVTIIDDFAFRNCTSLTSINIPNSVTSIEEWAFCRCSSLTSITIPSSMTKIKRDAFYSCNNLKEIKYTGTQQQWSKLLAKSRNFANWIYKNKVKVIFI